MFVPYAGIAEHVNPEFILQYQRILEKGDIFGTVNFYV